MSKVNLGHNLILRHILGKHELPYTKDLVEISGRSLKEILISIWAVEQTLSFPVSIGKVI